MLISVMNRYHEYVRLSRLESGYEPALTLAVPRREGCEGQLTTSRSRSV